MNTRREFLRNGGTLSGILWLNSTSIVALAPSRVWSMDTNVFSDQESRILLTFVRHIFPHDALDDAVYALVVKDLDTASTDDNDVRALIATGIAGLQSHGDWPSLPAAEQLKTVEAIAGEAFFEKVRSTAVVSLYNNELAFAHFGYAGSSFEKGGYLHRGFDDLDWLPTPPPDASPRPE